MSILPRCVYIECHKMPPGAIPILLCPTKKKKARLAKTHRVPGDKEGFLSGVSRLPAFTEVAGGAAWQASSTRRRLLGVLAGPQGLSKPGRKRVRSLKVFKGGSSPKKTLQA